MVILDVMMPGIDGFTVCKKIREKNGLSGAIPAAISSRLCQTGSGFLSGSSVLFLRAWMTKNVMYAMKTTSSIIPSGRLISPTFCSIGVPKSG